MAHNIVQVGPTTGGDRTVTVDTYLTVTSGPDVPSKTIKQLNSLQNQFSVLPENEINLASGDNTLTLPTATTGQPPAGIVIQLPAANTVAITVRDNTQTGGARIHPAGVYLHPFDQGSLPTSIIVNAASAVTGVRYWWL